MNQAWWKPLLLGFCAIGAIVVAFDAADLFGVNGRPWYGWWDSTSAVTAQPYVLAIIGVRPGGATAKAGLRDGDTLDLREQSLDARMARVFQPSAAAPTELVLRRDGRRFTASVLGSSTFEGETAFKVPAKVFGIVAGAWFVLCATLITLRRSQDRDARWMATILLLAVAILIRPGVSSIPSGAWSLFLQVAVPLCLSTAAWLLVAFSSRFGTRYRWRRVLEWFAYSAILLELAKQVLAAIGLGTLLIDPLPYLSPSVIAIGPYALLWNAVVDLQVAGVLAAVLAAVFTSDRAARPRTAWLLVPLPVALGSEWIVTSISGLVSSWVLFTLLVTAWNVCWLLGGFAVTYAILRRRVLDIEFVLGRTLVVTIVSLIVVASFILLEWALGTILAGASHATGLLANAALALVLGLSMQFIHRRVDQFVETIFFRKRREDALALRAFSTEAAFVTEPPALLDTAMHNVQRHTDATSAALFLGGGDAFAAVRSYGNGKVAAVSENDPAILALKAWHKPLDPHRYETELVGAMAIPMLGRGRLLGILLLGERAGGEAYAPDELDALSQFAHGVGSALETISLQKDDRASIGGAIEALGDKIDALRAELGR
ncbi:MAG TPA: GAF domain-containing protein [Candidatus Baltobacteraceae bacterium]|nr:GAF domain-containing protein [Candidatus Baltobacteraceae bacterium]